jgi:hypothetical protein
MAQPGIVNLGQQLFGCPVVDISHDDFFEGAVSGEVARGLFTDRARPS